MLGDEVADDYMVYDRNVRGPRGRFGPFSFVGSASPYTQERRGKWTFVGAMVLNDPDDEGYEASGWNLNAALADVVPRVRTQTGDPGYDPRTDIVHFLSQGIQSAALATPDAASLTASYRLSNYWSFEEEGWAAQQQWVFTPERLVGLVSLESREAQSADSMQLVVKTVSGR